MWYWFKEKGVLRAFSDLSSVDIENDTVKILGFHCSYNKQLADERNFSSMVTDIHNVLNLWTMRGNLSHRKNLDTKKIGNMKTSICCIYSSSTRQNYPTAKIYPKKIPMEIKYTKDKTLYIDW